MSYRVFATPVGRPDRSLSPDYRSGRNDGPRSACAGWVDRGPSRNFDKQEGLMFQMNWWRDVHENEEEPADPKKDEDDD